MQAYSNPKREDDPYALPNIDYWHEPGPSMQGAHDAECTDPNCTGDCIPESGWYWWPCFPGCMPDGEANGPFATEAECIADFTEEDDE